MGRRSIYAQGPSGELILGADCCEQERFTLLAILLHRVTVDATALALVFPLPLLRKFLAENFLPCKHIPVFLLARFPAKALHRLFAKEHVFAHTADASELRFDKFLFLPHKTFSLVIVRIDIFGTLWTIARFELEDFDDNVSCHQNSLLEGTCIAVSDQLDRKHTDFDSQHCFFLPFLGH
jgi:hypothetical protein